jgi:hypothetical protein
MVLIISNVLGRFVISRIMITRWAGRKNIAGCPGPDIPAGHHRLSWLSDKLMMTIMICSQSRLMTWQAP